MCLPSCRYFLYFAFGELFDKMRYILFEVMYSFVDEVYAEKSGFIAIRS